MVIDVIFDRVKQLMRRTALHAVAVLRVDVASISSVVPDVSLCLRPREERLTEVAACVCR
jgi:hypothetical protein